jgi:hypothetical protein
MTEERKYYVYEHWRPDTIQCFYVGKGHGDRAYFFRHRNIHHMNIYHKLFRQGMMVVVRIAAENLTEEEALIIESVHIARLRSLGVKLTNQRNGGNGRHSLGEEYGKRRQAAKERWAQIRQEKRRRARHARETRARLKMIEPYRAAAKKAMALMEKRARLRRNVRFNLPRLVSALKEIRQLKKSLGKSPELDQVVCIYRKHHLEGFAAAALEVNQQR